MRDSDLTLLTDSLAKVQAWVETQGYKGYEPFDGLSSWARPLTFGNLLAERLLVQLIRQSPINLRPIMGVEPQHSTPARGYLAAGYLFLHRATGQREHLEKARSCLDWLDRQKAPAFSKHAWTNRFDFSSRAGTYTSRDPIIVWTALIGQAYVDAFEATAEQRWLRIADSAAAWIMDLPRERTSNGDCLSYLASLQVSIHNANMLGAALLARVAAHTGNTEYRTVARSAMEYSCSRQLRDGAWRYAESPTEGWIDNFHTAYNLDSLKCYTDSTGDETFRDQLERGLEFFKGHFFENDGCPRYYHNRKYPVDIQCAGQAIDTLSYFADRDASCLDLAMKVARWTIDTMQDRRGYFYYRQYSLIKARTPMLHWGQSTMFKGLSHLVLRSHADQAQQS